MRNFIACLNTLVLFLFSASTLQGWEDNYTLLITGCARSGTGYISHLLAECGLNIGHEWPKKDGLSSWLFAVENDEAPWGPQPNSIHFNHIFHQVRHPLFVISSVYTTEPPESWDYIMSQTLEIFTSDSRLVKSAKYWYYWNLKAEERAEWTYRVEDIENVFEEFGERLGMGLDIHAIEGVPKNVNTRGPYSIDFTWSDLRMGLPSQLYEDIRSLAQRYGYILED